jgi:hypothetical protein
VRTHGVEDALMSSGSHSVIGGPPRMGA